MGFLFSKIIDFFSRSKNNFKIIILGIQNAGKTTILYRLSIGQLVKTTPTIGSNVEEISYNNIKFQAWDLGGQESMRTVWDLYYLNTDGIIYVIDSNDTDNIEESKAQFKTVLENETLKGAVVLIFANKQDIISAKKVSELINIYELDSIKDHIWHIQPCSAETGEGLLSGLKWLSDQLVYKSNNNFPNNPYVTNNELDQSNRKLSLGNNTNTSSALEKSDIEQTPTLKKLSEVITSNDKDNRNNKDNNQKKEEQDKSTNKESK